MLTVADPDLRAEQVAESPCRHVQERYRYSELRAKSIARRFAGTPALTSMATFDGFLDLAFDAYASPTLLAIVAKSVPATSLSSPSPPNPRSSIPPSSSTPSIHGIRHLTQHAHRSLPTGGRSEQQSSADGIARKVSWPDWSVRQSQQAAKEGRHHTLASEVATLPCKQIVAFHSVPDSRKIWQVTNAPTAIHCEQKEARYCAWRDIVHAHTRTLTLVGGCEPHFGIR